MDNNGWTAFDVQKPERNACIYDYLLVWHVFRGVVSEHWESRNQTAMYTHWKTMPRKGWICSKDKAPTQNDADVMNCVLARHDIDGIKVTGWHQIKIDKHFTHWMPTPLPPVDGAAYRKRF